VVQSGDQVQPSHLLFWSYLGGLKYLTWSITLC